MPYNLWSGSDYSKKVDGIASINDGLIITSSSDYTTNGALSYKLTNTASGGKSVRWDNINRTLSAGATIKLTADLLVNNTRSVLYITARDNSNKVMQRYVMAYKKNQFQTISVELTLDQDYDYLQVTVMLVDEGITYLDNVILTHQ